MKKIDVGQTINTLANVGVLCGLLFVGLQLMQDRQIAATQTVLGAAEREMYWAELIGSDRDLWSRGLAGEQLTAPEAMHFDAMAGAWELTRFSSYYVAQQLGLESEGRWIREMALDLSTYPGLLDWWERFRDRYEYVAPDLVGQDAWEIEVNRALQDIEQDER